MTTRVHAIEIQRICSGERSLSSRERAIAWVLLGYWRVVFGMVLRKREMCKMHGVETRGETKIVLEVRLGARHPFYLVLYYHACMHAC